MKAGIKKLSAAMIIAVVAMTANANAGALDAFKGEKGTIKIAGGTAHIPVMKESARLIMTENPDIQITIAGGGSGVGIKQLGEGLVDIGNTGLKPTDTEIAKYNLKMFQWAIDGVGVVVSPRNPVRSLTKATLQDIFGDPLSTGRRWAERTGGSTSMSGTRPAAHGRSSGNWPWIRKRQLPRQTSSFPTVR